MSGTDTAAMVPARFDCIIDGYGYTFWNALQTNLPFRYQRAAYSYSPTFVERQNVGAGYGDNQQDFWMTASQDDWSGGQGQRYFHVRDPATHNKAWSIVNGDAVTVPGQVTVSAAVVDFGNPGGTLPMKAACTGVGTDELVVASGDSHLWGLSSGGLTDRGAHGCGTVSSWGACTDGVNVYITGSTKTRKWSGSAFSDFSAATSAGSLAFLNNALYSCDGSSLYSYSTSGTQSAAIYTWRDATGTAVPTSAAKIVPFGGSLLIFFPRLNGRPQLWQYDGVNTYVIAEMAASATGYDITVLDGVVFLSSLVFDTPGGQASQYVPVVSYYVGGTLSELWRGLALTGTATSGSEVALGTHAGRLVFLDTTGGYINFYDLATGAITAVGTNLSLVGFPPFIASSAASFLYGSPKGAGGSDLYYFPQASTFASSAKVTTSLVDFDSALPKSFHGVRLDWEGGGTVDVKFQTDSVTGSFTTLKTGATSGTEYSFPANTTGHAVSLQIVLNNSGGNIPTLKRWYLRAAPLQTSFRHCQYVLDCTGRFDGPSQPNPLPLRDQTLSTLTGSQLATNLIAAITSSTPVSITDRFGTYTGILEPSACELDEVRPGEFVAQITAREV